MRAEEKKKLGEATLALSVTLNKKRRAVLITLGLVARLLPFLTDYLKKKK
jgi:hypothetical protein